METPQVPPQVIEKVKQTAEDNKVIAEANRLPFPGPAKEAFSVAQGIKFGPYTVRPFYDGDFDVLTTLEHPLAGLVFGESDWGEDLKTTRGQQAWDLCYLMVTPAEEIGTLLESEDGFVQFKKNAKKEFSKCQFGDLVALQTVIVKQFNAYFTPVVGFEAADEEGGKKKLS